MSNIFFCIVVFPFVLIVFYPRTDSEDGVDVPQHQIPHAIAHVHTEIDEIVVVAVLEILEIVGVVAEGIAVDTHVLCQILARGFAAHIGDVVHHGVLRQGVGPIEGVVGKMAVVLYFLLWLLLVNSRHGDKLGTHEAVTILGHTGVDSGYHKNSHNTPQFVTLITFQHISCFIFQIRKPK